VVLPDDDPPREGALGVVRLHLESATPRVQLRVFDGWGGVGRRGNPIWPISRLVLMGVSPGLLIAGALMLWRGTTRYVFWPAAAGG